ncbi:hypothetical protein JL720_12763 [Aureococcus anophagefferens]|nr:hypothetical protein JL720_12763 [Aureococcus anophagefferens]
MFERRAAHHIALDDAGAVHFRARDGLRRRPRSSNHPMSGGDAEAPPGPAHLRAREVLATFASDPTYGDLVHDDFDAAAFSNAVIVRDRDGAPGGEGGESHAEATVREVAARAATVEEAIEGHLDESRDKLIRAPRASRRSSDAEAVEVAAKEVRRRTRAMARKVLVPFEACAAKTKRLRLVFEANRLLRRCQRLVRAAAPAEKVGALDRVEQAGGGVELRELGAAAALVGDVERLLDDGGEGRLRGLDVLAGEVGFVAATRDRLRATAERSLRVALDGGHLADAAAALGAARQLGAPTTPPLARSASRAASRAGAAAVLDAEAAPARAGAVAVAGALAASLEAAVTPRGWSAVRAEAGGRRGRRAHLLRRPSPGGGASLVEAHWATILEDCGAEVAAARRTGPRRRREEAEPAPEEEAAAPAPATDDEATAAELDAIDAQSAGLLSAAAASVNAEHDAGRYGPPAAGAGAASALATALAAPLRPGDVRYDNLPVEAQVERCDEVAFAIASRWR